MNFSRLDDAALLQNISERQSGALAELYDRYGRLVYSVALNAVGDNETAEEIAQEVFLQVWRNAGSYKPGTAKVATWLTSITRYRSIDRLRSRKTRGIAQQLPWAEVQTSLAADFEVVEKVAIRLQQERVREAIQGLPLEQQQVLALAYFQGYSQSQIAALLDLPLGTVKTRVRLAMKKLREALGDDESP